MKCADLKHPQQPIGTAEDGVVRFKGNSIIKDLFQSRALDLEEINCPVYREDFPKEDYDQLTQLLSYSVSGWNGLSTSPPEMVTVADKEAERIRSGEGGEA